VDYRKLAIQKIEQVFAKADRSLTLDSSLLPISVNSSNLELFMRLRLSNWMRRVWTLLEGMVANSGSGVKSSMYLQLNGGIKEIFAISRDIYLQEDSSNRASYTTYSGLSYLVLMPMLQRYEIQQRPRQYQVFETWGAIRRRATSKRRDEILCMALILKLNDISKLLKLDNEDFEGQMIWFLQSVQIIPLDLGFQPCLKLNVIGFRWAPVSFLSPHADTEWQTFGFFEPCTIGPDKRGLLFKRQGLRLLRAEVSPPSIGENFLISHSQSSKELRLGYLGAGKELEAARNSANADGGRSLKNPAIISGQNISNRANIIGLLVDIYEESDDGRISCYFITRVGVTSSVDPIGTSRLRKFAATVLDNSQEWLLM
jgi:hypothetical protein